MMEKIFLLPHLKKGLGFALITATQSCLESDYIVFLDCDITITKKFIRAF